MVRPATTARKPAGIFAVPLARGSTSLQARLPAPASAYCIPTAFSGDVKPLNVVRVGGLTDLFDGEKERMIGEESLQPLTPFYLWRFLVLCYGSGPSEPRLNSSSGSR
jgi:hypothetical protein